MTDRARIIAEYEQQEARLGGPGMAREAVQATAEALGLTYQEVEYVMKDEWIPRA